MAEQTQTQSGTDNIQTPSGTGKTEVETIEVEGKKYVPLEKFSASATEAIRLSKENEDLKKPKVTEVPEDEKKVRDILSKVEIENKEKEVQSEKELRKDLDDLHTIYGDFDEKKLLKIVDRYGCYGSDDKVDWHAAKELYDKLGDVPAEPPKPKFPTSKREGAAPQATVETPVDVSKKSLPELVREGLKRFGM